MSNRKFHITEIKTEDKTLVASFISENWGSPIVVTKNIMHNSAELPEFGFDSIPIKHEIEFELKLD